jgi:CheY-like chemotaxis protein
VRIWLETRPVLALQDLAERRSVAVFNRQRPCDQAMPSFSISDGCRPAPAKGVESIVDDILGFAGLSILYAEDDVMTQMLVQALAEDLGHKVTAVADGAAALDRLAAEPFDLLLIDMQMPVMDGLAATRELRRREAAAGATRLPVIMLTANSMPEDVAAALAAGVDRHLSKPVTGRYLKQAIVQTLRSTAN